MVLIYVMGTNFLSEIEYRVVQLETIGSCKKILEPSCD